MQLPDEAITYQYQGLLQPAVEDWTAAAELRRQHFLAPARVRELVPRLTQVRGQVAAERELQQVPPDFQPIDAGFIDLPQNTLDQHRRHVDVSPLGRVLALADRLREDADRVVILGSGAVHLGARALFEALCPGHHNELPAEKRLGTPRIYFEGDSFDNDALQDLLDLLQTVCVDPELRAERWGAVVISDSGAALETAAALRTFMREASEYYGQHSGKLRELFVTVTGESGKLRDQCKADGIADEDILTIPGDVGVRYSLFTPAGLLPAAVMGLDVRALLLGAAAMTRRFLEEPFERNPVLQYAAVNFLLAQDKPIRVLAVASKKLEAVGRWHEQLLSESLGKQGQGPTPLTMVLSRDLSVRGQQNRDGPRDRVINNLVTASAANPPIMIGMTDHNGDDLNCYNRKGYPDLLDAAVRGANLAYLENARPTADLVLPSISEHTIGQLLQMLMLATVVEGRLMGVNPYNQPGAEACQRHMKALLKA
ncbi:MAG: glucose-6-phosphate isomerase [Planctomycetes bacterium]|nr:glucose-6-phosphate isomerase [Planctomycetota bacterium]